MYRVMCLLLLAPGMVFAAHNPLKDVQTSVCTAKESIRRHVQALRKRVETDKDPEKIKVLAGMEQDLLFLEKACPAGTQYREE